jgi:hypothetical protein
MLTVFFNAKGIIHCYERDKIQGCAIDPTDCDERTEDDMGRRVFSGIRFVVCAM